MTRRYYGWNIVIGANIVFAILAGTSSTSFGLFVEPVAREYALSHADVYTAFSLMTVGGALLSLPLGIVLDRQSPRRIMFLGALIYGGSLLALGLTHSPLASAVIIAVPFALGFEASGGQTLPLLIARWSEVQRARAMALAFVGGALGAVVVTPVIAVLIEHIGWRGTLVATGIVAGLLVAVVALIVRDRPGPADVEPGSRSIAEEATLASPTAAPAPALRFLVMAPFWYISVAAAISLGAAGATLMALAPMGQNAGMSALQAASLISVAGVATVAGKLLIVLGGDRFDKALILFYVFLATGAANAAIFFGQEHLVLFAGAALLGLFGGSVIPVHSALIAERFGVDSFGTVRGLMAPLSGVSGVAMARLAGEVYDRSGSYRMLFAILTGAYLLAALLMLATRFSQSATSALSSAHNEPRVSA